jgi:putative DNA primase/helicase
MSFIDFARAHGVEVDPNRLYPSERIKRCGTVEKPKSLNGAYFWDGQRGWVFDWSGEARTTWYEDPHAKPWTDEEKRQWALKRQVANSEKDASYENASKVAEGVLAMAKLKEHNYLIIKGFPEEMGLVVEDKLLIPMRNVTTNKLQGYQEIRWNEAERKYEKKMQFGMRARNAVYRLGVKTASETWLVEGYATGLSVYHALRSIGSDASVVVCFSATNLVQVADQIKGQRYIFADNDESKTGERSAEQTGLPWTMADDVGNDANDLHMSGGLFALVGKIMQLRRKVLTSVSA